jgi:hypothetical protein
MGFIARGNDISLYVNGKKITSTLHDPNNPYYGGTIGLSAGPGPALTANGDINDRSKVSDVMYSNLDLWAPQS